MRNRIYLVLGIAGVLAGSGSGCTTQSEHAHRLTEQDLEAARTRAVEALANQFVQPAARPVPPAPLPAPESDFQFCLLSAGSCLALDPRPFVLCPVAGDSVCDAKGSIVPLGSGRAAAEAETRTEPATRAERSK
jgi:hypothetical protein